MTNIIELYHIIFGKIHCSRIRLPLLSKKKNKITTRVEIIILINGWNYLLLRGMHAKIYWLHKKIFIKWTFNKKN